MLLKCHEVGKEFVGPRGGEPVTVLRDVTFQVEAGDTVAITGPSGSGKSTLLNLIGTLDEPTSGEIQVEGQNIAAFDDAQRCIFRAARVGFIFQLHHLLPQCTVLENVLVPTLSSDAPQLAQPIERARDLLDKVGLADRAGHRPGELSGGERLRVAVARALINEPKLLLADEPTGSLDERNASQLVDLLLELNRDAGVTLLMVTHASELASRLQRSLRLHLGQLVEESAPAGV